MDTGHDEYWSAPHRANVEAAHDAGVNLAFFTGNGVFWKTRWENNVDGSNTPNRTLVCYKETLAFQRIDPLDPPTWTGTWRDPTFSPPGDGGKPENALTGNLFMVNGTGADNPGNLVIRNLLLMLGHHRKAAELPVLTGTGSLLQRVEPQYCDVKSVAGYCAARCISFDICSRPLSG